MKKLILALCLLVAHPVYAVPPGFLMMAASGTSAPAGTVYTDCSEFPTGGSFYWNADHTSGTTYACTSTSTTLNGTMDASVVDSDTDPGTSSPDSGNNVLKLDASGEDITWTNTANNIFDINEGLIEFDVYLAASANSTVLFRGYATATNYLSIYVYSTNVIRVLHEGNDVVVYVDSTDTVSDTTWTKVYARWSLINNQVSVKIGSGNWVNKSSGTVTEATDPDNITFIWGTDTRYVDNVKLSKDSGL